MLQWLALLLYIQEAQGSNLCPEISCLAVFLWFLQSVHTQWNITLEEAMAVPFHILFPFPHLMLYKLCIC